MKTFVAAAAAVVLLASPAFAAPPAPMSWTGFYLGGQAGYSTGIAPSPEQGWTANASGLSVGAFGGYNYDLGGVVIGAEVGANWDGATGNVKTGAGTELFKLDQNWDASLVGHLGVSVANNFLLYGLAGGSITQLTGDYVHPGGTNAPTKTTAVSGVTAGLGAEFKVTDMVSLRGEYRFAAYSNANLTCSACGKTTVNYSSNAIRVGLVGHW